MVKDKVTFLTSEKTVGTTTAYTIINPNPLTKMYVSLLNTSAGSSVVNFEGMIGIGTSYQNVSCTNMLTGTSASFVSGTLNDLWEVPLAGYEKFRLNVILSSGSLTAVGKVVQ